MRALGNLCEEVDESGGTRDAHARVVTVRPTAAAFGPEGPARRLRNTKGARCRDQFAQRRGQRRTSQGQPMAFHAAEGERKARQHVP